MIIELLPKGLIIPGEPPSRANIGLDYKLKNVPAARIKNKGLRQKKERWDRTNLYKDQLAMLVKNQANLHGIQRAPRDALVWVNLVYYFHSVKHKNPAMLVKDSDNCMKLTKDAIAASGMIENDCQIVHEMITKQVSKEEPRLKILSIAVSDTWAHFDQWLAEQQRRLVNEVYEHILKTQYSDSAPRGRGASRSQ